MSSSIHPLPVDLYHEIAAHVQDAPTLAALALVSQAWNTIATSTLYRRELRLSLDWYDGVVPRDQSQPRQLEQTLRARPDLAALATAIHVHSEDAETSIPKSDLTDACDVLEIVLRLTPNIVSFRTSPNAFTHTTSTLLFILGSCKDVLERLLHFDVPWATDDDLCSPCDLLSQLSSLQHLHLFDLPDNLHQHMSFSLQSLYIQLPLSNGHLALIASSSHQSLMSIRFMTDEQRDDPPDWTTFPNLTKIDICLDYSGENYYRAKQSLATCLVAETIAISLYHDDDTASTFTSSQVLQSLPSSLVSLDLSRIVERVDGSVLEWLRDGEAQWPNLRCVKMRELNNRQTGYESDLLAAEQQEESGRMRLACEEVAEQREVVLEWTEC